MEKLLLILALGFITGCQSHQIGYHSHSHIYQDELNENEIKDLESFLCLVNGQFKNRVTIESKNGFRIIKANNIPEHETGQFPGRGNPHAIKEQDKTYKVTLKPEFASKPTRSFPHAFGVALNGVFFEPSTAEFWRGNREWNQEAINAKGAGLLGLDKNYAHVQPDGSYHYHGIPVGLEKKLEAKGKMTLIGYAADGFPIYSQYGYKDPKNPNSGIVKLKPGYKLKNGNRPAGAPPGKYDGTYTADYEFVKGLGDLDEYNGRFGVTPEYPNGTYYYVVTESFPFISRGWKGTPDKSFFKGPPGNSGERRRPPRGEGPPPPRF